MENNYLPISKNFATLSIHSCKDTEGKDYSCLVPPAVSSINFKVRFSENEDFLSQEYTYSRIANPTRKNLEQILATLESGKYGLCFASGCGSISSVLGVLKPGSHIICSNEVYGGATVLFSKVVTSFSFTTSFVNIYNLEELENAIQPNTALIWIEPVSNPLMKVADVKNISKIAKKRNILLAVDNTFLSPYFHRPLEFGADIVCQSLTKYINGHGDVIMGALILNKKDLYDKLKFIQYSMGVIPSPNDCAQVLRSLKTFPLRMKQHNKNAIKVAKYLENHPNVLKVIHPSLPSHPQHELFKSLTSGHSGVVSFYINGGLQETKKLLNNFNLITSTTSFGSIGSIAQIPLFASQSGVPKEQKNPNVTDNLVRLSVGLEDIADIIDDLKQALDNI